MIKIIDMDKLFDEYISKYVYDNIGKVSPDEIENSIPNLYVEFGNKTLKQLDGKTPNTFYQGYSAKELIDCLKKHLETNVQVSDFLCETLQNNKDNESALLNELSNENDEEFTVYLMNMLGAMASKLACKRYLEFVLWDYSSAIKELATELLCEQAEEVKDEIIKNFNESSVSTKALLTQILSHVKNDDRAFEILINEFIAHPKEIPLYAGYLARFGDEKALPYLLVAIENKEINYQDFCELKFAIEALGGEYNKQRDFLNDSVYKKIKSARQIKKV